MGLVPLKLMLGIYQIKNINNDKIYIGSSVDIDNRWWTHKSYLRNNKHCNPHLQYSWNKYGEDAFEFSVIYEVDTVEELIPHEQWCLDTFFPEYNIALIAGKSMRGRKLTAEERVKRGRSGKDHHFYGKHHSEEHKKKVSAMLSGENHYNYGTHRSEETKEKLRIANIGKRYSKEINKKKGSKGTKNHNSKLTDEKVKLARYFHKVCNMPYKKIAKYFDVHYDTICGAITGKSWKHVKE